MRTFVAGLGDPDINKVLDYKKLSGSYRFFVVEGVMNRGPVTTMRPAHTKAGRAH